VAAPPETCIAVFPLFFSLLLHYTVSTAKIAKPPSFMRCRFLLESFLQYFACQCLRFSPPVFWHLLRSPFPDDSFSHVKIHPCFLLLEPPPLCLRAHPAIMTTKFFFCPRSGTPPQPSYDKYLLFKSTCSVFRLRS